MRKVALIVGSALALSTHTLSAAEPIDKATVLELRQLAIEAGQTSSSTDKKPGKSEAALKAEREAIERHRAAFFERTYGRKALAKQ